MKREVWYSKESVDHFSKVPGLMDGSDMESDESFIDMLVADGIIRLGLGDKLFIIQRHALPTTAHLYLVEAERAYKLVLQ